ncbi:bifunctional ADP-dependent NAD(P)H-hydrate dehydratase/NAD(P)H-hydrate epimerase [Christiangramia forsetii]|uniref:Bifunctional NAD(P)H-hydrate repair enzyme n=2 Tax=Christiangramia forsetii TaxID=411153 RepID=A0M1H7_CHRFK|nr:bifunctional ADP-dependent NAD(P)H-hydrate dehydratase/NAD(P)H-hydrate epimerase [Christiangramia forsetii]GGG42495.1 bifunctional NAD(P)H-hydrate repair enzyme [Christiangramia forsetii]CAL66472.1 carbohydrate kinase [Christiangramia forsetii KT0803]
MKILSAEQLSEADKETIKKQNISSEELMERAATLVFNEINNRLRGAPIPIKIFCGIGNNGGDGLVVARHLIQHGYNVTVYVVNYSDKRSEDFLANYEKLKEITNNWPQVIKKEDDFPEINIGDFVIDAIFGIGLNRPIEGWVAKLVEEINHSKAFTLAVDMPSGLFADKASEKNSAIIEANYTLSFQSPKLVFFLPETMDYVGDLQVLDIGLDREFIGRIKSKTFLIGKQQALSLYLPRKKNSHKGDYGSVLIAGGSYGKIGSVLLTATAALRSGTGLCSLYIPKCGYNIIQTGLPEAMVVTDPDHEILTTYPKDFKADVVCFGMGAGTSFNTVKALKELLELMDKPVVIDADGLNILSENNDLLKLLPENSVLTPHPGELKRLVGAWKDDFHKLDLVKEFSSKYKVIVVIKGAHSLTIDRDNVYVNNTGNPGMATAGSGDVLSGVITSLIGQGYEPVNATVLGIYLHGLSGDISAEELGYEGVLAGDIAKNIGKALSKIFEKDATESDIN